MCSLLFISDGKRECKTEQQITSVVFLVLVCDGETGARFFVQRRVFGPKSLPMSLYSQWSQIVISDQIIKVSITSGNKVLPLDSWAYQLLLGQE